MKISLNYILGSLLFYSFAALSFAYISQYHFDMKPCQLCLYQRWPFLAIIAICVAALSVKIEKSKKVAIISCVILLILNASIALYHVGVEKKIFKISESCATTLSENYQSVDELKTALQAAPLARCDEPQFFFLSLSMAAWNALYCIILAYISSLLFWRYSRKEDSFPGHSRAAKS